MDKNKVVAFVKTHKKEIAIVAGLTAAVGFMVAQYLRLGIESAELEKKGSEILEALRKAEEAEKNGIHDIFKETLANGETCITAFVDDMTPADLGKLGEEMLALDGANPDTMTCVIASFKRNQK